MDENIIEDFEGLIVIKGGYLKQQYWVSPTFKDDSDEIIEEGYYTVEDITEKLPTCLYESCILEDEVTLRDVFILCDKHRDFFSIIQQRNFFTEYIDYGLNAPKVENAEQGVALGDSSQRWQRMQIDRNMTIEYGYVYPDDVFLNFIVLGEHEKKRTLIHKKGDIKEESLEMYIDFHGMSFPLTQEEVDGMDSPVHYKVNEEISLGFLGYSIEKLMDIPLIINSEIRLYEQDKDGYNSGFEMRKMKRDVRINLGDIIETIFHEISFHGSPEKSRKFGTELDEMSAVAHKEIENMSKLT